MSFSILYSKTAPFWGRFEFGISLLNQSKMKAIIHPMNEVPPRPILGDGETAIFHHHTPLATCGRADDLPQGVPNDATVSEYNYSAIFR